MRGVEGVGEDEGEGGAAEAAAAAAAAAAAPAVAASVAVSVRRGGCAGRAEMLSGGGLAGRGCVALAGGREVGEATSLSAEGGSEEVLMVVGVTFGVKVGTGKVGVKVGVVVLERGVVT